MSRRMPGQRDYTRTEPARPEREANRVLDDMGRTRLRPLPGAPRGLADIPEPFRKPMSPPAPPPSKREPS